jgi:hypothetical protein
MDSDNTRSPHGALDWGLAPLDYSSIDVVDTDWGLVEIVRIPGTHKVPALLKSKQDGVTLTGCRRYCLYPSDFRCRNLPCFKKRLMDHADLA